MTGAQVVRRVELPLSLPLIFGGIRTSAVNVVATATLGPLVGVVTLGDPIINTNVYGEAGRLGGRSSSPRSRSASEVLFAGLQRVVDPARPQATTHQEEDVSHEDPSRPRRRGGGAGRVRRRRMRRRRQQLELGNRPPPAAAPSRS